MPTISLFTFHISHLMLMLNSNEPIKVAHLQKSANQSMLNDALVIEMVNNSLSEIWAVKHVFPLNFARYLS